MNRMVAFGFLLFVLLAFVYVGDVVAQGNSSNTNGGGPVVADFSEPKGKSTDGIVQLDDLPPDVPVSDFVEGTPQSTRQYIYEKPTYKALANFSWAIGFADLQNDEHIDNYLKLTECDIYKKFVTSEFEMKEIRDATRRFISENRSEFSTRFELVQKIQLQDYDIKRRAFKVLPKYQIQSVRRFELFTTDLIAKVNCGHKGTELLGFPPGLILEMSRPFTMTYVPAPADLALEYIDEKSKTFQSLGDSSKTIDRAYSDRSAYLVFYAKAFAFRRLESSSQLGFKILQTMAVLEGVEVYGDVGRKQLFFSKSFLSNKSPKEASEKLLKEYKIIKEMHEGDGVFH